MQEKGCIFSKEKHQIDPIFLDKTAKHFIITQGMIVLRIRTDNNENFITLKQRKEKAMESKEIEFKVSDKNTCKDFIETLGYKEMVTVDKKRIETKYKEFNICIDEVKELGSFIEIEVLTEKEVKASIYEKEMMNLCKELKIDTTARVNSHYDTMIYELKSKE